MTEPKPTTEVQPAPDPVALQGQIVPVPKHPGGRPTTFKPEYLTRAIEIAEQYQGCSLATIAHHLGVAKQRISQWTTQVPEFADVINKCRTSSEHHLSQRLCTEPGASVNVMFLLKAQHGWNDRPDLKREGPNEVKVVIEHRQCAFRC